MTWPDWRVGNETRAGLAPSFGDVAFLSFSLVGMPSSFFEPKALGHIARAMTLCVLSLVWPGKRGFPRSRSLLSCTANLLDTDT